MLLRTLLVAVALLVPVTAHTVQAPPSAISIQACVQQGTHGSLANLSHAKAVVPGHRQSHRRTLYWFDQNLAGFADRIGQEIEITAELAEVIDEPRTLQSTDGVFAEVQPAPDASPAAAAAALGGAADVPIGTSGTDDATPEHPVIVKARVNSMRLIGSCR
ncbi:MAG: hypothetical protein AB7N65_06085 [Vicinamibacterales bacterium]